MKRILISFLFCVSFGFVKAIEKPFTLNATEETVKSFIKLLSEKKFTKVKEVVKSFKKFNLEEINEEELTVKTVSDLKSKLHKIKEEISKEISKEISFIGVQSVEGLKDALGDGSQKQKKEMEEIINKYQDRKKKYKRIYNEWIKSHGGQPLGLWNSFVYYILLGSNKTKAMGASKKQTFGRFHEKFSKKLRKKIWKFFKKSGLIQSKIKNPVKYTYDPASLLKNLVKSKKKPTVVLACGHFLNTPTLISLNLEYKCQTNCGMCKKDHTGEITINNDATQLPDIYANVRDLKFWKNISIKTIESIKSELGLKVFYDFPKKIQKKLVAKCG